MLDIEHRLSPPKRPQTDGMVERFNGRRFEQVLRTYRFNSALDLEKALYRFAWFYNEHLLQRALDPSGWSITRDPILSNEGKSWNRRSEPIETKAIRSSTPVALANCST